MRVLVPLALLLVLGTFAPLSLYREPALPSRSFVAFEPLILNEAAPAQRRLGQLTFLEGWHVSSNDPRFGGISAIHVEGRQVTAVSDSGAVMRFSLPGARRGPLDLAFLEEGPGSPYVKFDRDTEAMAVHGGDAWIVFERRNVVWRYSMAGWRTRAAAAPAQMKEWGANSGGEGIVRLADGRFLIFSEGTEDRGGATEVLLFSGDPADPRTEAVKLAYLAPEGFRVTDAAALPDGGLLFLNRRFSLTGGFAVRITYLKAPKIGEGALLRGDEIARFEHPVITDNLEALSVSRERGRTILWIASDDNHTSLQRTLFLKFALEL